MFYGIGTILGGFSTAFLILANNSFIKGSNSAKLKGFINISAGLWMTLIREMIFMIMFLIFYGIKNPKVFKNIKYSFSRGGRLIIYSVICNFVGDVAGIVGIVLLLGNTSLSSVFETSFIIFTFIVASFTFKHKFNWKSFVGVICVTMFMLGIFFVNFYNHETKSSVGGIQSLIGMLLMFLANIGYLLKNILTEYVYKNRLLDTQTTQLFATFFAFLVGLIIVPMFFFIFQPLLLGKVSVLPWQLLPHIIFSNYGGVLITGIVASIFLLAGRNFQYANTMISGASVSNIFYQGKLIVVTVFAVVTFAIWGAIGHGSLFPYTNDNTGIGLTFSEIMKKFNYDNWIYWILIFLLFFSIVYTVLSNQDKYEKNTYEYRKKRNVKHKKEFANDKYETKIYGNKSLDEMKLWITKKRKNNILKKH